ncbi:MAG: sigma 54-dependent Fis family transcriptional regulator [Myxococcales bacterium]|nr:sigma 54-dependent Fis family transcriptional regulator [Myxococcales bacterium]
MAIFPRSDGSGDETRTIARAQGPRPLGAMIRVLGARCSPAFFRLSSGSCVLGAGASADIVIQNDTVSRAHVELSLAPEGVVVRDLGSRNGTFYLGQRLEKIVLGLGSRVRLGAVEVAIDADTEGLAHEPELAASGYRGLIGISPPMRRLCAVLHRLEGSLVSVLLQGESGSGKELIARAIHEGSSVHRGPLVVVNCGAIARELVLSELFGHRRGSFTGAIADRQGAFEAADGGTLFLDEVGELPLDVQPALLRALEAGEVQPVGSTETRRVKVRIVAATNRDLDAEVRASRFREDLFYRLAVVRLVVPPLRERREDIPLLANHFAASTGLPNLPPEALASFSAQTWPGNARELRNAVQAFVAIGALPGQATALSGELASAIKKQLDVERPYAELKEQFLNEFTRVYLERLLARTNGNQSEAARISGLDRSYLGKMIGRFGVSKP